jgi:hypothetical protein
VALSLISLIASSLGGTVVDPAFSPVSRAQIRMLPERRFFSHQSVTTDENGSFVFSDVAPGEYTVLVDVPGYIQARVPHIRIREGEDHILRRIFLEAGEAAGACVVRLSPSIAVQHTGEKDMQISGRVSIRHNEKARVTLSVLAEEGATTRSTVTETGQFRFVIPVEGTARLSVELLKRSGLPVLPAQSVNMPWTDLGDKVSIPKIRIQREGLGHWCY